MKILFVIDRLELKYFEFNTLVTNFWLIKDFLNKGNEVFITTIDKLSLNAGVAYASAYDTFQKDDNIFYGSERKCKIEDFELVMFRPDPPVDLDYINATYVFDFVDRNKTIILNDTKSIRDFNEKLHAVRFNSLMPENIVTSQKSDIINFLKSNGEAILKPLNGCFGSGVMYLKFGDKNTSAIINSMTKNGTNLIMVQKYLPSAVYGDKRILILGDEVFDYCVKKLPGKDDFKFNEHNDDYVKPDIITVSEKNKFLTLAHELNELGIYMAGLDVVDEKILEINVTSPCYFIKEINTAFDIHFEDMITDKLIKFAEKKCLCS